jgi:cytochrome c peroxidase
MVRKAPTRLLGASVLAAAIAGCGSPGDPTGNVTMNQEEPSAAWTQATDLDRELRAALLAHSGEEGLEYFRLPRHNEMDKIPQDPKNPLTHDKVKLGRFLYHETALAVNNLRPEGREAYSCASCHHAQGGFMANLPQGMGEGASGFGTSGEGRVFDADYDSAPDAPDCQPIRTPTAMNTAYQELMLWNGQFGGVGDNVGTEDQWTEGTPKESNRLGLHGLETQAHAGLAVHRMGDVELSRVAEIPRYRAMFRKVFPDDPEPINRLNAALAIAAYERTLLPDEAPFQLWLRGKRDAMTPAQKHGAIVFFGKGECATCHTGPALNSMTFHALGMNDLDGACDSPVNLGPFGGSVPDDVRQGRGGFTKRLEDMYKFKTPQLYNLMNSPFLGHGASFPGVRAVVEYKNAGVPENAMVPPEAIAPEFHPLGLAPREVDDLVAFIEEALYDANLERYLPSHVPSGNCFPTNDPQSQIDLGCARGVALH